MSLNDKISSPTGIAKQLTSPNNFFKKILAENIPISNCTTGQNLKNIPVRACEKMKIYLFFK